MSGSFCDPPGSLLPGVIPKRPVRARVDGRVWTQALVWGSHCSESEPCLGTHLGSVEPFRRSPGHPVPEKRRSAVEKPRQPLSPAARRQGLERRERPIDFQRPGHGGGPGSRGGATPLR